MKRTALAIVLLGALGMICPAQPALAQGGVSVSINFFYDELSPHGEWIDCSYGECWVPRGIAHGWQPYSNGEWIYTRYGWTWVSSDPWGGDPFHYGTWAFIGRYGWVWVPGTVWAPAWVTWNYGDRYVGWAPMPPTVSFGRSGYSGRAVVVPEAQYVFVPTNRFVGTNVTSVRVEPGRNAEIFRQGKAVTRFDVSGGIVRNMALPMATVKRATAGGVPTREISAARTAPRTVSSGALGKAGHVGIVAPASEVKAARASHQTAAPHATAPEAREQQAKPQAQPQQQQQSRPQQHEQAKPQQQQQARPQQPEQAKPQQQQQAKPQPQQQAKPQPQQQHQAQPQQREQAKPQQQQAKPEPQQQQPRPQQQQQARPQQPEQAKPQQQHQAQPPQQQQQQAKPLQHEQQQKQEQARPEQGKPGKQQPMVQDKGKPPMPTPQVPTPPQPTPQVKPTMTSDPLTNPDRAPSLQPSQPQQIRQRTPPPVQEKGRDESSGTSRQPAKDEPPK